MVGRNQKSEDRLSIVDRLLGDWGAHTNSMLICVIVAFVIVGTAVLWGRFAPYVLGSARYQLTEESFEVTSQPPWVPASNIVRESVASGNLAALNMRQPDLTVRVAQAFSAHPWVRKVNFVSKRYASRVLVELSYRRPVAMVEVVADGKPGLLPIDDEGILLPTVDFSPESTDDYVRISVADTRPVSGLLGTPWGDDRVHDAARVAAFLQPYQKRFGLAKIVAYRRAGDASEQTVNYFVIRTVDGGTIVWGRAPGEERTVEPAAEQKIAWLQDFAEKNGGLQLEQPDQMIDLSRPEGLRVAGLPATTR